MELDVLLQGLEQAAKSPLAFVAYCFIVIGWLSILWKESRIKNISKALGLLPKNERLKALELEYKLIPKKGLNADEYLTQMRRKYYFLAFGLTTVAVLIVATLTIYRYIQLDRINVANETMNVAYETFIRGTTTADDNRFKTSIGKLEESLIINPSYSGYINLADIYDEVGNIDGALWASTKAAELDSKNPSPELNIGMFLKDKGQLKEAEIHLLKAKNLFEKMSIQDDEFMVTILVNLGNVYYEKADAAVGSERKKLAKKALDDCYSPALKLRGSLKNKRFLANLLGNTANNYRLLEEFDKAESYMFQSIALKEKLAKQSPLWGSLGVGYYNLGDIYLKQGNIREAKKYFALSKDIFDSSGHVIGIGSVYLSMGEIAKIEGDFEIANEQWVLARQIFSANNLELYTKKAEKKLKSLL